MFCVVEGKNKQKQQSAKSKTSHTIKKDQKYRKNTNQQYTTLFLKEFFL